MIEDSLRHEPAKANAGDKRDRLVMAVRNGGAQPPSAPAAPAFAREIGRGAGLVDEDELLGIEVELALKPFEATLQHVRALLLRSVPALFLNVTPWQSKKRHSTELEKCSPQLLIRRSCISRRVMSGVRRISPMR